MVEEELVEYIEELRREVLKRRLEIEYDADEVSGYGHRVSWDEFVERVEDAQDQEQIPDDPHTGTGKKVWDPRESAFTLGVKAKRGKVMAAANSVADSPATSDKTSLKVQVATVRKESTKMKQNPGKHSRERASHQPKTADLKKRQPKRVGRKSRTRSAPATIGKKSAKVDDKYVGDDDPDALHCICQTKADPYTSYIGCGLCKRWFHNKCMNILDAAVVKMNQWFCPECIKARDITELFCVCHQPEDTERSYIFCDACQDWFHPECVGITKRVANKLDLFFCPNCRVESTED